MVLEQKVFVFPMVLNDFPKMLCFLKTNVFWIPFKSIWIPNEFETESITWCNGFYMIFKNAMFLKHPIFGNPPKVQFWNCWENSKKCLYFQCFCEFQKPGICIAQVEKCLYFQWFWAVFKKDYFLKSDHFQNIMPILARQLP